MSNDIEKNHGNQENLMKIKVQTELLQRIARYLMLHASFTSNIGLLNGKTGIAVFFYHCAKYTGKHVYDDFAGELIDEIYKEIHVNTLLDFKDGLCGIAWGIGYLIRNGFIDGDPDAVLEDLDKRIVEWDVRRISDHSLETGLTGIACYVISRMENREKKHAFIRPDYVCDLLEAMRKDKENTNPALTESLENIVNGTMNAHSYNPVFEIVDKIRFNAKTIFETPKALGINKAGYAGTGLKLMEIGKQ